MPASQSGNGAGAPRRRRRAVALLTALLAVGLYVGGAWLSATLSPGARRPILDGNPIPQPYRWVTPPPSLAKGNKPPNSGRFSIKFDHGRLVAGVFSTNDQQATVVCSQGAIPQKDSAKSVRLIVRPVDPASVAQPRGGLSVLGNVYRVAAAYDPSGDPVTTFRKRPLVVLVYPALITHGFRRSLMFSPDGKSWSPLKTTDDPTSFQASATVSHLNGYFAVATNGTVSPVPTPGGGSGASSPVPWVVIGVAAVVGAGLVVARWRARAHQREYESYRGARSGRARASKGPAAKAPAKAPASKETPSSTAAHRKPSPPRRSRKRRRR